jgi:hypothetical protein
MSSCPTAGQVSGCCCASRGRLGVHRARADHRRRVPRHHQPARHARAGPPDVPVVGRGRRHPGRRGGARRPARPRRGVGRGAAAAGTVHRRRDLADRARRAHRRDGVGARGPRGGVRAGAAAARGSRRRAHRSHPAPGRDGHPARPGRVRRGHRRPDPPRRPDARRPAHRRLARADRRRRRRPRPAGRSRVAAGRAGPDDPPDRLRLARRRAGRAQPDRAGHHRHRPARDLPLDGRRRGAAAGGDRRARGRLG